MRKSQITTSAQETQNVGAEFAAQILHQKLGKQAVVLALYGDLGAGKTTFLQGFAKGLGIKEVVNSPTFIIMKKFKIPTTQKRAIPKIQKLSDFGYTWFYHFDLYRLENEKDLEFLRFKDIISNPENIVAIEWAEKISNMLPENTVSLTFGHLKKDTRKIDVDF